MQQLKTTELKALSPDEVKTALSMEIVQRLVRNVAYALREAGDEEKAEGMLDVFQPLLSSFENAEERSGDYPNV